MTTASDLIPGERFEVNLDDSSDDEEQQQQQQQQQQQDLPQQRVATPFSFVGDIQERRTAAPKPPSVPTLKKKNDAGFPSHPKRPVESRFKQRKGNAVTPKPSVGSVAADSEGRSGAPTGKPMSWEEQEKQRIDEENKQKMAGMSADEIEEERGELMSSLSPALIDRLLKSSNIESGSNETRLDMLEIEDELPKTSKDSSKKVTFAEGPDVAPAPASSSGESKTERSKPQNENLEHLPHDSVHFPQPSQPADLDPSSSNFLQDLHTKYFPSLPSDPSKLAWMQSDNSTDNPYDSAKSELNPKDLRFSFKGELLAPNTAALIPVTEGLHNHGDAPDSAGYTISELAHLARSTFPGQRCIAFQTLGRILFRLGKGEFGDPGQAGANTVGAEDTFGELARSLWREMDRERVVDGLVAESEGNGVDGGRHVSAKAYATEAVWLWRKGGGRKWRAE